jgi:hypothetical protein
MGQKERAGHARRWGAAAVAAAALVAVAAGCETDQQVALVCERLDGVTGGLTSQHLHTKAEDQVAPGAVATLRIGPIGWPQFETRGQGPGYPYTELDVELSVNAEVGHIIDLTAVGGNLVGTTTVNDGQLARIHLTPAGGQPLPGSQVVWPELVVRAQTHLLSSDQQLTWSYRGFFGRTTVPVEGTVPVYTVCRPPDPSGRLATTPVALNHTNLRYPTTTPSR